MNGIKRLDKVRRDYGIKSEVANVLRSKETLEQILISEDAMSSVMNWIS